MKYPPNLEVRDLTVENKSIKGLVSLIGLCDMQFTISCNGTTIHVYQGKYREPSISEGTNVKKFRRGDMTFWLGGNNSQILSTFKFIEPEADISNWKTYSKTSEWFGYTTEYPSDWSFQEFGSGEIGTGVRFLPPSETSEYNSISIVIINYSKTPPSPVFYTYTTLRKVKAGDTEVLVQKREPGSERYIAAIKHGDYTAEFRFPRGLDSKFDSIFDHLVSSFKFTK